MVFSMLTQTIKVDNKRFRSKVKVILQVIYIIHKYIRRSSKMKLYTLLSIFFDHFLNCVYETCVARDYLQKGKNKDRLTVDHFGPSTLALGIAVTSRSFDSIIWVIGT